MDRKEAIEIIIKNYPHVSNSGSQFESALRELIPELTESDGEKIRQMIERTLRDAVLSERISETSYREMWAYLKKQKTEEWSEEDKKMLQSLLHDYEYAIQSSGTVWGKDFEKKHNWLEDLSNRFALQPKQDRSEEDEKLLDFWLDVIDRNDWRMDENFCKASREFINRLKSLRPQPYWKPTTEQMEALEIACNLTDDAREHIMLSSLYEQLKSL